MKYLDSIYPLLLDIALLHPYAKVIVPLSGKALLSPIPNLRFYFVEHLREAIEVLNGFIESVDSINTIDKSTHAYADFGFKSLDIEGERYFYNDSFECDFSEVLGQDIAKRAALIAAAGFHN